MGPPGSAGNSREARNLDHCWGVRFSAITVTVQPPLARTARPRTNAFLWYKLPYSDFPDNAYSCSFILGLRLGE